MKVLQENSLTIWLVTIGEPLPVDGDGSERLLRHGLLANYLVQKGHKVVWWTSDFYHQRKRSRFGCDKTLNLENGLEIRLLHSIPYNKNISLQRIINHWHLARKFKKYAKKEKNLPDIILASYPPIELPMEAVKYGVRNKVPVVVDVRDIWPDIFVDVIPQPFKKIAKFFLYPYNRWAEYVFKNAYAVTGITEEFVKIGLDKGKRDKREFDISFSMGYPDVIDKNSEIKALDKLERLRVHPEKFIICFFGTVGYQFDFGPVTEAASILKEKDKSVLFVICGEGDRLEKIKVNVPDNILFPGWLTKPEIWALMKISKCALAPYIKRKDFLSSITNKIIEYLCGGLPILSSIEGKLGYLIRNFDCGMVYKNSGIELVQNILTLKNNPDVQKKMSENARRLFEEKFPADKVYLRVVEYLEEVAGKLKVEDNKVMDYYKINRSPWA